MLRTFKHSYEKFLRGRSVLNCLYIMTLQNSHEQYYKSNKSLDDYTIYELYITVIATIQLIHFHCLLIIYFKMIKLISVII